MTNEEILKEKLAHKMQQVKYHKYKAEKLEETIKEVREYINKNTKWYDELLGIVEMHGYNTDRIPIIYVDELLEILDKENKNE